MSYEGPGPVNTVLTGLGNTSTSNYAAASITIAGNSGTATGSTITFDANSNAGSSVTFSGASSTVSLIVSDVNSNTIIGGSAGNGSISGSGNTGIGLANLFSLTSGAHNTALGYASLDSLTTGSSNVAIGRNTLFKLISSASYNTAVGDSIGSNYTGTESSNIAIGYNITGTTGESNVLRIGNGTGTGNGQLNTAYIQGIAGNTVANPTIVTQNSATGQMGTIPYAEGTFTPGISFGNGTTGIVYSVQSGKYTRIGNVVYFALTITTTSKGSSTGAARITGLPITVGAQTGQIIFFQSDGISPVAGFFNLLMNPTSASTNALLYSATNATGSAISGLSDTNFINATTIRAEGFYFA